MTDSDVVTRLHPRPLASEPAAGAPPFLVVGVGASAGGLEAVTRLLQAIPGRTPIALVFVQHLARDQPSMLPELLATKTELTVRDAVEGERIVPSHVYVIRPNTHPMVVDGCLRVGPRPEGRQSDVPVDHLFDSMAEQYREKALGVVLSGGGSDGAFGVQRIRGVGGITVAQEPTEAQVDGMPRSAIATGSVDMVLPAEQIAAELIRLAEHPFYQHAGGEDAPEARTEEADLQQILRVLHRVTGVDFARYKAPTIRRRIQRRMALHRVHDVSSYLGLLRQDEEEARRLHDDILIHVTSFFREPESFDALKELVLPKIIEQNRGDGPIRAWVPACSSGEEAYSLAICLLEVLAAQHETIPVVVFGTDLSQRMVEQARAGLYPDSIASDVSPERLRRFFVKVDDGYRVSAEVRERCVFARQDITRDPPFSKLDLVMCRNLLIYLSQPAQRKLMGVFHYALLPHGVLALGRSETIGALPELFSVVDSRWKLYQRRPGIVTPDRIDFGSHRTEPLVASASASAPRVTLRERRERDFHSEANRVLLDRYAPPLIIVDDAFRIVRSQGRTTPFLELPSGDVSLEVLKLIRSGLLSPLRGALQEARTQGGTVRKQGLEFRADDEIRGVSLEVTRVGAPDNFHYLILFEDPTPQGAVLPPTRGPQSERGSDATLEVLQQELTDTRADLQSMIQELEAANEELQSANEEILSSNEELQSTNEELDTAREELQATNEELGTVNEELQARNLELSRANSDLVNLLDSVDIPIVMVTADLKIRRFTPAAERTLNLITSDVGRPIGHIKPNIRFPDLERVLQDVIDKVVIREREVTDQEGRTYVATARPYRNLSNRIDGAALALLDVSQSLEVARETGEALMSTVRDPILLLESDLVVRRANEAFFSTFRVSPEQTHGHSLFELGDSQWDIPALRQLLLEVLPGRRNFESFAVEHEFPGIGRKRMLVDGRRISSGKGGDGVILLIIRDEADDSA